MAELKYEFWPFVSKAEHRGLAIEAQTYRTRKEEAEQLVVKLRNENKILRDDLQELNTLSDNYVKQIESLSDELIKQETQHKETRKEKEEEYLNALDKLHKNHQTQMDAAIAELNAQHQKELSLKQAEKESELKKAEEKRLESIKELAGLVEGTRRELHLQIRSRDHLAETVSLRDAEIAQLKASLALFKAPKTPVKKTREKITCTGKNRRGTPCQMRPLKGKTTCRLHTPPPTPTTAPQKKPSRGIGSTLGHEIKGGAKYAPGAKTDVKTTLSTTLINGLKKPLKKK